MDDKEVLKYKEVVLRESDLDLVRGPCFLNDQIIAFYFNYLSSLCDSNDVLLVPPSVSFWLANSSEDQNLNDFLEPLKLATKKLVLFTINDNTDFGGGEDGTHWSLLVYDRTKNCFSHHDTMQGVNNFYAMKLYEALKGSMGIPTLPPSTKPKTKNKNKKPSSKCLPSSNAATPPIFVETPTPQQTNGYDCGIYVIAIARAICHWFSSQGNSKVADWLSAIQRHVDASTEITMRDEILKLIQDLQEESADELRRAKPRF